LRRCTGIVLKVKVEAKVKIVAATFRLRNPQAEACGTILMEIMLKALLLLAFGGPRSLEEVEFLLTRLFRGRKPSPEQLEKVKERYRLIGGFSPLPEITQRQAKALEEKLNAKGHHFKSYVGMRYSRPLIEEIVDEMTRDGIDEIIALPMAPFRSRASTGAYAEELNRVRQGLKIPLKVTFVEGWHTSPIFLDAVQEKVLEGLNDFSPEVRQKVHLLFTAHSLPISLIQHDPYAQDMEASVKGVLSSIESLNWHIAFQSKGGGPEEWIGPDVEKVLEELASQKVKEVLLVPIGFVSDHIEILYDIDIVFRQKAESLGMVFKRTRSLNTSERFIEALAKAVEERIRTG
jgi:protoporphyrin/coproporphyrin ferrochelatase